MTSVNMPRDNAADRINPKASTDIAVKEISPYPRVERKKPQDDVTRAPRRLQARKNERRKKQQKVLLDTRSGRDRRNAARASNKRVKGEQGEHANSSTGIDVYS